MLVGQRSLGDQFGITERIEGQAGDWEPFGDLLLTAPNQTGDVCKIGASIKSNRQITTGGCNEKFCAGLWATISRNVFAADRDSLALFSAPLSRAVTDHLHSLCRQARHLDPARLDQKVVHKNVRKIYDSFRSSSLVAPEGLSGNVLRRFLVREFDFEALASKSEAEAIRLSREALALESRNEEQARRLWQELLDAAQAVRVSGAVVTRQSLATLRYKFNLLDDPSDVAAWAKINKFSGDCLDEITTVLPGGLNLPRAAELKALEEQIAKCGGCYVLGDSGFGKSALVKRFASEREVRGDKIVWMKAERISQLDAAVPDFVEVARRSRRSSALLIIDSIEGCYHTGRLGRIARIIKALVEQPDFPWSVIVICQTPEWSRINSTLVKELGRPHPILTERVDCGPLSDEDFDLVRSASLSVDLLAQKPSLRGLLRSPKMLDVLLTGQLAENRGLAGEADLVEWWWENQVRGSKQIAAEENVARQLAIQMADELRSELPLGSVSGAEAPANNLIQNRVLRRTPDGLLRFDHDLLADWSRVMHLKSLGDQSLAFIRAHTENPPWLRAVRLLSQHLLDRAEDVERWRHVLEECSVTEEHDREPSPQNLQIVDAWLEGIVFSVHPRETLEVVRDPLFAKNGWRLRRLLRRLIYVATVADPVVLGRVRQIDSTSAETVASLYRLPLRGIWPPGIDFLVSHKAEVIQMVPVELGQIAGMWARMEEYFELKWQALADLVMFNAETELRREVAGEYRHYSGPHGRGNKPRISIYTGALHAASQHPKRAAKLLLKAAGLADWEKEDIDERADATWKGEWHDRGGMAFAEDYVEMPATSWPNGPRRKTSDDFFHSWFDGGASLGTYRAYPQEACDATMAFLLDWPRRTLMPGSHSINADQYGFTFEADHMYPPFYNKGPFLSFLRHNWQPALELITRLTNFATDRYADWWPYESKPTWTKFATPTGDVEWLGNDQVYVWHRFNFNTPQVITCALMALEKWLDEQIAEGKSIKEPIETIFCKARSVAFAGLLIGLGKRHPKLFLDKLKPLLFVGEFFTYDFSAARDYLDGGYWPHDGKVLNDLRREWSMSPGRKVPLLDACCSWFISRPELQIVLTEVSADWKKRAELLSGEDRLALLRWAANFELSNWQKNIQNREEIWERVLPEELRDVEAERAHVHRQASLRIPYRCSDLLEKRPSIDNSVIEGIWHQLHNWLSQESPKPNRDEEEELTSSLLDDKHSRAGLLAVLLSLGGDWLDHDQSRRTWVEDEVRKLLSDPPRITAYSAEEIHEDGEGFLARCSVRCWASHPTSEEWRGTAASFVGVFRYHSIAQLFNEAFRVRERLGGQYEELEALALALAVIRQKAEINGFEPKPEIIQKWMEEWLPKFAKRRGPKWTDKWSKLEFIKPFRPPHVPHGGIPGRRRLRSRRSYGFDMGVVLAVFGGLPSLNEARNTKERRHWFTICKELLAAYIRTLPPDVDDEKDEMRFDVWSLTEKSPISLRHESSNARQTNSENSGYRF